MFPQISKKASANDLLAVFIRKTVHIGEIERASIGHVRMIQPMMMYSILKAAILRFP